MLYILLLSNNYCLVVFPLILCIDGDIKLKILKNMNEKQNKERNNDTLGTQDEKKSSDVSAKSEHLASKILRGLAMVGLVVILILAIWTIVQGVKLIPNAKENLSAMVSPLQSLLKRAPEESISFEIDTRTLPVGVSNEIGWGYIGDTVPDAYYFSYECDKTVSLDALLETGWTSIECGTPFTVTASSLSVMPVSEDKRFVSFDITIQTESGVEDSTVISVLNADISGFAQNNTTDNKNSTNKDVQEKSVEKESDSTEATSKNTTNNTTANVNTTGSTATKVSERVKLPVFNGPADLVLNIEETGIIKEVDGEDVFFPISPIPTDEIAAVKFTVTNKGGKTAPKFNIRANLPVEGNDDYLYKSDDQAALTSGFQLEYTLAFDELLEEDEGVITIKLNLDKKDAKSSNNEDSVIIKIED